MLPKLIIEELEGGNAAAAAGAAGLFGFSWAAMQLACSRRSWAWARFQIAAVAGCELAFELGLGLDDSSMALGRHLSLLVVAWLITGVTTTGVSAGSASVWLPSASLRRSWQPCSWVPWSSGWVNDALCWSVWPSARLASGSTVGPDRRLVLGRHPLIEIWGEYPGPRSYDAAKVAIESKEVGPAPARCRVSRAMRWLIPILLVSLSSCLQIGKGGDSDSSSEAASAGSSNAGSSGGAATTGTNCGVDPDSGIALCLGISSCPTVRVDPDQFPDCGYRIAGSAIDLECLCGDSLCPMGKAASCSEAKALLFEQSAQGVCAGIAEGRCAVVQQTSHTAASSCDKDCRAQCGGVPGCLTLCGC